MTSWLNNIYKEMSQMDDYDFLAGYLAKKWINYEQGVFKWVISLEMPDKMPHFSACWAIEIAKT